MCLSVSLPGFEGETWEERLHWRTWPRGSRGECYFLRNCTVSTILWQYCHYIHNCIYVAKSTSTVDLKKWSHYKINLLDFPNMYNICNTEYIVYIILQSPFSCNNRLISVVDRESRGPITQDNSIIKLNDHTWKESEIFFFKILLGENQF